MTGGQSEAPVHMFTAGYAQFTITPPSGAFLAGYSARSTRSEGVHDDLCARALTLSDGERSLAMVSVDVMAVDSVFVDQVRSEISAATGLEEQAIMIAATHTHGGPVTTRAFPQEDQVIDLAYMEQLKADIVNAVAIAWQSRFPAKIGMGATRVDGVGGNRHRLDGATDPELGVLKIEDLEGRTRAVCMNYACHPTILGPDNLRVTADFPGFAVARVTEHLGSDTFAMFLNGASGNISVGRSPEATALGIPMPGRTFERAEQIGHQLADLAIATLPSIETSDRCTLDFATSAVDLELRPLPPAMETEAAIRNALDLVDNRKRAGATSTEIQHAQLELLYARLADFEVRRRAPGQKQERVQIQCFRIGGSAFLAIPLEPFTELGLELKQAAGLQLFVVGLANGYFGYLPSSGDSDEHAYETLTARFLTGSDRVLVSQALNLERLISGPYHEWRTGA
jgi:neutral ceramidase